MTPRPRWPPTAPQSPRARGTPPRGWRWATCRWALARGAIRSLAISVSVCRVCMPPCVPGPRVLGSAASGAMRVVTARCCCHRRPQPRHLTRGPLAHFRRTPFPPESRTGRANPLTSPVCHLSCTPHGLSCRRGRGRSVRGFAAWRGRSPSTPGEAPRGRSAQLLRTRRAALRCPALRDAARCCAALCATERRSAPAPRALTCSRSRILSFDSFPRPLSETSNQPPRSARR